MTTTQGVMTLREEWYERPSYTYPAVPGEEIGECYDCGSGWRCALETDEDAPYGLAVREWHHSNCPVWAEPEQE